MRQPPSPAVVRSPVSCSGRAGRGGRWAGGRVARQRAQPAVGPFRRPPAAPKRVGISHRTQPGRFLAAPVHQPPGSNARDSEAGLPAGAAFARTHSATPPPDSTGERAPASIRSGLSIRLRNAYPRKPHLLAPSSPGFLKAETGGARRRTLATAALFDSTLGFVRRRGGSRPPASLASPYGPVSPCEHRRHFPDLWGLET